MKKKHLPLFSPNVIFLSLVSFLNDIGGETIKKAIPLYLITVLGVKPSIVGLVEGIGESVPQLLQPISGYISDLVQTRKSFIILGQLLRSLIIFLLFATTWPQILLVRILDRSGKGIYNAPRDALVTDSSEKAHVGRSFGLTRMFDNAGAVVGLLIAAVIVAGGRVMTPQIFQTLVMVSAIPLVIALGIVIFAVKEIHRPVLHPKLVLRDGLGRKYYRFLALSILFTLGNSSDAFLILRTQQLGVSIGTIFLFLALYSLVSSLSGLPLSSLSDRIGRKRLLVIGWLVYSVVYLLFAQVGHVGFIAPLFVLYGLYYGLTEGAAKAWIADLVPEKRRGAAFGIYNMAIGVSLFPASFVAGWVWQQFSLPAAFYLGSACAGVAALGLFLFL